ncbi:DUF2188 domain-containing protein [Alkalihalobacillus sp. R86527]|uniref:DUF2188 domain-containing protein n=1 Tax=Alkalihalobacillus sp. R86527 TaxID=3093863 RepID=UPI00366B86C1
MKEFTVAPNKDVTGWYVKVEDVAPTDLYKMRSDAVEKAEELAQGDTPSKVLILDEKHEVEEERKF